MLFSVLKCDHQGLGAAVEKLVPKLKYPNPTKTFQYCYYSPSHIIFLSVVTAFIIQMYLEIYLNMRKE